MIQNLTLLGVIITLLAIILAVPLTIIGNILTPRLLNWWASRTKEQTRRRIIQLQGEIAELEHLMTSPRDTSVQLVIRMFLAIFFLAFGLTFLPMVNTDFMVSTMEMVLGVPHVGSRATRALLPTGILSIYFGIVSAFFLSSAFRCRYLLDSEIVKRIDRCKADLTSLDSMMMSMPAKDVGSENE